MDSRGWNDIGYNFLIGEDGRIYEGIFTFNLAVKVKIFDTLLIEMIKFRLQYFYIKFWA